MCLSLWQHVSIKGPRSAELLRRWPGCLHRRAPSRALTPAHACILNLAASRTMLHSERAPDNEKKASFILFSLEELWMHKQPLFQSSCAFLIVPTFCILDRVKSDTKISAFNHELEAISHLYSKCCCFFPPQSLNLYFINLNIFSFWMNVRFHFCFGIGLSRKGDPCQDGGCEWEPYNCSVRSVFGNQRL